MFPETEIGQEGLSRLEGSRFDEFGDVADEEDFDWPRLRPDGMYHIPAIFKMN